jgi:hypothetical protein
VRVVVSKEAWTAALARLASEIDYTNFKDAVERKQGKRRHDVYMSVWGTLLRLEERTRPRSKRKRGRKTERRDYRQQEIWGATPRSNDPTVPDNVDDLLVHPYWHGNTERLYDAMIVALGGDRTADLWEAACRREMDDYSDLLEMDEGADAPERSE